MAGGDWGWEGLGDRVLEFPEINDPKPDKEVAPVGRLRLRNNTPAGQLEISLSGSPWGPITVAGGGGPLAQAEFYIDPVGGDDSNSGATAGQALATWAEYTQRMGVGPVTASPFQLVTLLNDLPASDPMVVNARYSEGLVVQGQRTTLVSGTVTAAVAWDTTSSPVTPGTLEDLGLTGTSWSDSGPGGSSLIGKQVVMTSGANVGKTGWLLADLGAKVARISLLYDTLTFASGTPAPGDTFDVVDLTVVAGGIRVTGDTGEFVNFDRLDVTAAEPLQSRGGVIVPSDSKFVQTGFSTLSIGNGAFQSIGCLYTTSIDIAALGGSGTYFNNSFIDARVRVSDTEMLFFDINALQKAGGSFATSTAFTCSSGGSIFVVTGGIGVMDQAVGAPDAFAVGAGSMFGVGLGSRAFTLAQSVGRGISIGSYGFATWHSAGTAGLNYDFDISGPAIEWSIGGATDTSAALGAAGSITASNNAGAVPRIG
jgi:hypothetical protein